MKAGTFAGFPSATPSQFYGKFYYFGTDPKLPGLAKVDGFTSVPIKKQGSLNLAKVTVEQLSTVTFSEFNGAGCTLSSANMLVLLGTDGSSNAKLAYSTNNGSSWTYVTTAIPYQTVLSIETDNTHAYFLTVDIVSEQHRVYKFDSSAHTYTLLSTPNAALNFIYYSACLFYRGGIWYYFNPTSPAVFARSTDCVTWTYATDATVLQASAMVITGSKKICFVANGLMYVSTDQINGPWAVKYLPFTGNMFIRHLGGERCSINGYTNLMTIDAYDTYQSIEPQFANVAGYIYGLNGGSAQRCNGATATPSYIINGGELYRNEPAYVESRTLEEVQEELRKLNTSAMYFMPAVDGGDICHAVTGGVGSSAFFKITVDETVASLTTTANIPVNHDSATGYVAALVTYPRLDPTKVVGCMLSYKPDDSYRHCDGSTTYGDAACELKRVFPKVTHTFYNLPHGAVSGSDIINSHAGVFYVNSTFVAFLSIFVSGVGSSTTRTVAYSTDAGVTWNYGTTLSDTAIVRTMDHDGTYYYLGVTDDIGNKIYRGTTLTSAFTNMTAWAYAAPTYMTAISGSNLIVVAETGAVYQSVNNATSWSLIATIGSVTVTRVKKIGSTWYACTSGGIFSTTNFTSWTLVSATTNQYYELAFNSVTSTWATIRVKPNFPYSTYAIEHSTDNMATWKVMGSDPYHVITSSLQTQFTQILDVVNGYFVNEYGNVSADGVNFVNASNSNSDKVLGRGTIYNRLDYSGGSIYVQYYTQLTPVMYTIAVDSSVMQMPYVPSSYLAPASAIGAGGVYMKIHA